MAKKKKARATNAAAITPSAPTGSAGEMASAVKAVQWLACGAKNDGGWTWLEMLENLIEISLPMLGIS